MKFPSELMIEYKNNKIKNKEEIIHFIETVEKKELISNYLKVLELLISENKLNEEEAKLLIDACNKKINKKIELKESLEETKQNNPNFSHISIVETKKENNDKINGYSKDINYIKYTTSETTKIYEVTNEKALSNFLTYNQKKIKEMTEEELLNNLTKYSKELNVREIDNRQNDYLNSDSIKKEIDKIEDATIKEAFKKDQNNVLKERLILKEFNKNNNNEKNVKYALNSLGERIYLIGDVTIKFEGPERNMKIIENNREKTNNISTSNLSNYNVETKIKDEPEIKIKQIEFDDKAGYNYNTELLNSIIEAIAVDVPVNDLQIKYLERFLNYCVTRNEMNLINSAELQLLFDKYYNYTKENPKFLNDNINKIMERYNAVLNRIEKPKTDSKAVSTLENENVKKLKLENNNYRSGFVVTTIILEVAMLLGAILAMFILVK